MKKSKETNQNKKVDRADEWMMSVDHHLHTSEWFGILFFYLFNFGQISFKELSKSKKKNIRVGYVVQIVLFFLLIYLTINLLS